MNHVYYIASKNNDKYDDAIYIACSYSDGSTCALRQSL